MNVWASLKILFFFICGLQRCRALVLAVVSPLCLDCLALDIELTQ